MLHHCWCEPWWRRTADWRNRAHQGAIRFLRNLSSRTVRWRISSLVTQFTRLKKTGAWINWHWFNTSRGGVVQWTIASRNLQWNWTVKQSYEYQEKIIQLNWQQKPKVIRVIYFKYMKKYYVVWTSLKCNCRMTNLGEGFQTSFRHAWWYWKESNTRVTSILQY